MTAHALLWKRNISWIQSFTLAVPYSVNINWKNLGCLEWISFLWCRSTKFDHNEVISFLINTLAMEKKSPLFFSRGLLYNKLLPLKEFREIYLGPRIITGSVSWNLLVCVSRQLNRGCIYCPLNISPYRGWTKACEKHNHRFHSPYHGTFCERALNFGHMLQVQPHLRQHRSVKIFGYPYVTNVLSNCATVFAQLQVISLSEFITLQ